MTAPTFQGKTSFVRQFIAAVKAAANAVVDSSVGSITLALAQAATGVALWLQAQIAAVITLLRAATCTGSDLDTFFADFFFTRLPAIAATGAATFARATPTNQAVVLVGQFIQTGPGGIQYVVTQDTTNSAWNGTLGGYVLPPSTASISVPIAAVVAGSAGNVLANTITSFVSPIAGVDTVTNAAPLTNGLNAESDPAFRARFALYILGFAKATLAAIRSAIAGVQQGIASVLIENKDPDLTTDYGFVTIVVDDGTGTPPDSLVTAVSLAVDLVRAAGIRFGVIKPVVTTVSTITLTLSSIDTTKHAADILAAQNAILAYGNTLAMGASLIWSRLFQVAFDASANINEITNLLVNGATADITVTAKGVIKVTTVTVS